jgi:hypothetical protein
VGGLVALVDRSISAANAIGKTADTIGVGAEALQELRFAAKASGVEQQTLDLALQRFTRRAAEAAQGTGEAKDALAQMGIALRDQSGNLRSSEDLLGDVADAFARIENPADRVRLAFKLFDSEGVALVNLLRGGSHALEEIRERARDLGIVLDEHLVRDAERARTELDTLSQVISANLTRAALEIQGIDEDLAKNLGLNGTQGALVSQVTPKSPAAAAGLEQGDVILSYNGQPIKELRDLTNKVAETDPGKNAEIKVWRDGKQMNVDVEIGTTPGNDQVMAAAEQQPPEDGTPKLGVVLAKLTPEARQSLDLPADLQGVIVADVQEGSPAAIKGLQSGDVIVEVDHQQVTEPKTVADAVRDAAKRGDESILLLVKHEGQDRFVAVPLERT